MMADGPVASPATNSGVARGLLMAASAHPDVADVVALDIESSKMAESRAMVSSMVRRPLAFKSEYRFGAAGIVHRSRMRDIALCRLAQPPDLLIHVRNVYEPAPVPYAAFIDSTTALAVRGWPDWSRAIGDPSARIATETRFYGAAQFVFTASRIARTSVIDDYGVDSRKVVVVGGGVNFDPLPQVLVKRDSTPARPTRVLFVGTEFARKGGDLLVGAVRELVRLGVPLRLDIVGERVSAEEPWLTSHGKIADRTLIESFYRDADIFCLPARHEPYGLVIQEAMSFGLPCVGTRVGAMEEIIDHGITGLVVPQGDQSRLAEALKTLCRDPELRYRLGLEGRMKVERELTWNAVFDRMVQRIVR